MSKSSVERKRLIRVFVDVVKSNDERDGFLLLVGEDSSVDTDLILCIRI